MGDFVAKIKGNDNNWFKLISGVTASFFEDIDLTDNMLFNPNNNVADQWFRISEFNNIENDIPPLFRRPLITVELENLSRLQYKNMELFAYYHEGKYYIQKVNKGSFFEKKWFSFNGDLLDYQQKDDILFINPVPHCIFDSTNHTVYFKDITKAYAIYTCLKTTYREATREEVERMLNSDIIDAHDMNYTKVGLQNRRRISSVINIYENYSLEDKQTIKNYIRDNIGDSLLYNDGNNKFVINNDIQLRILLFGLQKRFFKVPLDGETQVATSVARFSEISNG